MPSFETFHRPSPAREHPAPPADSTAAAMAASGATYRQLDYWVRRGLLHPDNPTGGSGTQRRWPAGEVRVACAIARLVDAGVPLELAADIARAGAPAEGTRRPVRLTRGAVLVLYPDMWAPVVPDQRDGDR